MKVSEFKRWLKQQGATFEEGAKHTKVLLGGKKTTLPRHGSAEIKTGLMNAIKTQLGLK